MLKSRMSVLYRKGHKGAKELRVSVKRDTHNRQKLRMCAWVQNNTSILSKIGNPQLSPIAQKCCSSPYLLPIVPTISSYPQRDFTLRHPVVLIPGETRNARSFTLLWRPFCPEKDMFAVHFLLFGGGVSVVSSLVGRVVQQRRNSQREFEFPNLNYTSMPGGLLGSL